MKDATESKIQELHLLVEQAQIEFVLGGVVMSDEAVSNYVARINQLQVCGWKRGRRNVCHPLLAVDSDSGGTSIPREGVRQQGRAAHWVANRPLRS